MFESIKKISNPLTIIAIFAGLAEVSGTVVLPFMKEESQSLYVWFLMAFPTLLILLFFLTLNFNYKVLYAPSDFKDKNNFLKLFRKPTAKKRISKLNAELETESVNTPFVTQLSRREFMPHFGTLAASCLRSLRVI